MLSVACQVPLANTLSRRLSGTISMVEVESKPQFCAVAVLLYDGCCIGPQLPLAFRYGLKAIDEVEFAVLPSL
jgi:hypothetical protein